MALPLLLGGCTRAVERPLFNASPDSPATGPAQPILVTSLPGLTGSFYRITALNDSAFRIVWTGTDTSQLFTGAVYTDGTFTRDFPGCDGYCSLEDDDVVSGALADPTGQRIQWDTVTGPDDRDGLELTASTEPLVFDLRVDGQQRPDLVFYTAPDGTVVHPPTVPFSLTSVAGAVP